MTWSAVGSPVSGYVASGTLSLTVSPTAIGDIFVAAIGIGYNSPSPLPAGGGVTTWSAGLQNNWGYLGSNRYNGWAFGVITATGPQTITLNTGGSYDCELIVQQFHNSVPGSPAVDTGSGASGYDDASGFSPLQPDFTSVVPSTTLDNLFIGTADLPPASFTITLTGGVAIPGASELQLVYLCDATAPTAYQPSVSTGSTTYASLSSFLTWSPSSPASMNVQII